MAGRSAPKRIHQLTKPSFHWLPEYKMGSLDEKKPILVYGIFVKETINEFIILDEETDDHVSVQKSFLQVSSFNPGDYICSLCVFNKNPKTLSAIDSFEKSAVRWDKERQDKMNQKAKIFLNKEQVITKMNKVFHD